MTMWPRALLVVVWASTLAQPAVCRGPLLVYGTAWKKGRTTQLVLDAWFKGFRAFDTGAHPEDFDEALVGQALRQVFSNGNSSRSDAWVQTKFSPTACESRTGPKPENPYDPSEPRIGEQVRRSYRGSIRQLGVQWVDLYMLRSLYNEHNKTMEAWRAMEEIFNSGGAKSLGVCNVNIEQLQRLYEASSVKPSYVQNKCLHTSEYDRKVREFCLHNGIQYQVAGLISGNPNVLASPQMNIVAAKHNRTVQQIMYRLALQQFSTTVLVGTQNATRLSQAAAVKQFLLSAPDIALLREVRISQYTARDPLVLTISNRSPHKIAIFWRDPQTLQLHPNGCVLSPHGTAGGQCIVKAFHSHVFVGKILDKPSEVVWCWQADLAKGATQNAPITLQLSVRFWNTGREPVMVFWLDNRGKLPKEIENARVPAASSITIQTIVGHQFVIRRPVPPYSDGKLIKKWTAEPKHPGELLVQVSYDEDRNSKARRMNMRQPSCTRPAIKTRKRSHRVEPGNIGVV